MRRDALRPHGGRHGTAGARVVSAPRTHRSRAGRSRAGAGTGHGTGPEPVRPRERESSARDRTGVRGAARARRRMRGSNARGVSRPRRRLSKPLPYHSANPPGGRSRAKARRNRPGRPVPIGAAESSVTTPAPSRNRPDGNSTDSDCRSSSRSSPGLWATRGRTAVVGHTHRAGARRGRSGTRRTHYCAVHGPWAPLDFGQRRRAVNGPRLSAACPCGSTPSAGGRDHPSCRRSVRRPRTGARAARSWHRRPDG